MSALERAGFVTTAVGTASAAASWLAGAGTPDVVVMELLPKPEEAWALIERGREHSYNFPMVILTSLIRPDGSNRRKARTLGCAAFVAKPCSLRQLVDFVSRVRYGERKLEIAAYSE